MPPYHLHELTTAQLAEAADENFIVHVSWVQQRTAGMKVIDDSQLLLTDAGLPTDTFNIVCRARLAPDEAPARIAATLAYFQKVDRPFCWWVGPADQPTNLGELLLAAGLVDASSELAMAVDLTALHQFDLAPAGLVVRRVETAAQMADFALVNVANWSPPDPCAIQYFQLTAERLLAPDAPQWFYIGYLAGQPVAASELTIGGGVVGMYNVCTLEAYRRRGFGMALTLRPLLDARAAGYGVGVLQAAAQGVGIYARIGFRAFGGITEYKLLIS
jgi:ribosomal protein S18 acetylase RimI-like enzyme